MDIISVLSCYLLTVLATFKLCIFVTAFIETFEHVDVIDLLFVTYLYAIIVQLHAPDDTVQPSPVHLYVVMHRMQK